MLESAVPLLPRAEKDRDVAFPGSRDNSIVSRFQRRLSEPVHVVTAFGCSNIKRSMDGIIARLDRIHRNKSIK